MVKSDRSAVVRRILEGCIALLAVVGSVFGSVVLRELKNAVERTVVATHADAAKYEALRQQISEVSKNVDQLERIVRNSIEQSNQMIAEIAAAKKLTYYEMWKKEQGLTK